MKNQGVMILLVVCIVLLSMAAAAVGIFSNGGPGEFTYTSIRGQQVQIYGRGVYQHMSAELAPQGIAQDVVTLFIGIPLLLVSLYLTLKGSPRGKILLTGTLGYFLVTYLFYLVMGMFNPLYMVYVVLVSASFFAFTGMMLSKDMQSMPSFFGSAFPRRFPGGYLIFNAIMIALLWLNVVVPPLLQGGIPVEVEHYTTLIVQGLDLSLLLPIGFMAGFLLLRNKTMGYLLAPVYYVFLSVLMTALTAKIIAMALAGYNVIPVIFIIPLFNVITVWNTAVILRHVGRSNSERVSTTAEM